MSSLFHATASYKLYKEKQWRQGNTLKKKHHKGATTINQNEGPMAGWESALVCFWPPGSHH